MYLKELDEWQTLNKSTCVQNTRALASSPLLSPQSPQSPHPNHLSKHLLNAAQVIHMGAQPANNANVLTVHGQCRCAHSAEPVHMCPNPASNHRTIWRSTCSYATGAKVTRGVVPALGGHSCSKTPPYQLISSRGKDKQKELACSESTRSI